MSELPLKWGLELEYASMFSYYDSQTFEIQRRSDELGLNLKIGSDESPIIPGGERYGIEFRTQVPWTEFPKRELQFLLSVVEEYKMKVNERCGLHFHFSGVDLSPVEFDWMTDRLKATNWWRSRQTWINKFKNPVRHEKYQMLREVNGVTDLEDVSHFEARVFNGTKCFHGVYQPWKFLNNLITTITKHR